MNVLAQGPWRLPSAAWLLLLLPMLVVLPPVPIDETRYLSIAWEMHQTGQWITLHLNGAPYFDKPPLLFWLLNAIWSVLGASLWSSRALLVACGIACVALCSRLERELDLDASGQAGWLMLGLIFFVLYTGVVMFDVLLCLCVLAGFIAIARYMQGRNTQALWLLLAASVFGVLAKGPVMLLHLAGPILLSPWWSGQSLRAGWRRVLVMLLVAVLGGLPALAWAWAAVHGLSAADAQELLLNQTAGRVVKSFAHNRAFWWYLPWVPVLLLPWPLLLRWRRVGAALSTWRVSQAARFGWSATVPALLAFCLVSGKQLHYLLPVLPGAAILLGAWTRHDAGLLALKRLWCLVALIVAVFVWSWLQPDPFGNASPTHALMYRLHAMSAALLLFAVLWLWRGRATDPVPRAAQVTVLLALAMLPLVRLQVLAALDVRPLAQQAVELRERGVPVARTNNEPGLLTFLARMPAPLAKTDDPLAWCQQHPEGVLLAYSGRGRPPPEAVASARLANGWVAWVPAQAVLRRPEAIDRYGDPSSE